MPSPEAPKDILDRLRRLERMVEALQKADPLKNASIGKGGLRFYDGGRATFEDGGGVDVRDGGGIDIYDGGRFNAKHPDEDGGDDAFSAGRIYDQDMTTVHGYGALVQQANGQDIFVARTDEATGGTLVRALDRNERVVFATDPDRGGMSMPWMPFVMAPSQAISWESTNATTFTRLYRGYVRKGSPKAGVALSLSCAGGVSGEARVLRDGVQVGATLAAGAGGFADTYVVFDLPDPMDGTNAYITVEARVTGGTGNVFVAVDWAEARG